MFNTLGSMRVGLKHALKEMPLKFRLEVSIENRLTVAYVHIHIASF